jgi:LuxR family maltose regulon positive regulatory protein
VYLDRLIETQVRLWLTQGDVATAASWASTSGVTIDDELNYLHERQHIALARALIAQGQPGQALGLLARLRQSAEAGGQMKHVIEILTFQALAFQASGANTHALTTLQQALALGQVEGYVRTFVDAGAPMAAPLRMAHAHGIVPEYVEKPLATFPRTAG